jgi:lipopolysaccharide transport system ATP-binding protein
MSDTILKVDNVSKQYRLGTVGTGTIGHDLNRWWHTVRGKEDPYLKVGAVNDRSVTATSDYVWALRGIDFEVKQGEILGIFGKNGAGKSTFLKILSRVTSPTIGSIKTKGNIASLLEVGTGMHPELTGKENIFLNGAILGMTKAEIKGKIDEIVEFSGCQMYIDTPVKRYSSGMRVRLGFAVAAFLEPDILVVDEVLAVGDAEFQKKAIGKMQDISRGGGRTVLFVSHNMASIKNLCTKIIVLENGSVDFEGPTDEGISHYLTQNKLEFSDDLSLTDNRQGSGLVIFKSFHIEDNQGAMIGTALNGGTVVFCFELNSSAELPSDAHIDLGFSVHTKEEVVGSVLYSSYQHVDINFGNKNSIVVKCVIHDFPYNQGDYVIKGRILCNNEESDWLKDPLGKITVLKGDFYKTGNLGFDGTAQFLIKGAWSVS